MNDPVQRVAERVQDSMDAILKNFKAGAKITLLVRAPDKPTADFCMTDDDLGEVIAMVRRRMGEAHPLPETEHLGVVAIGEPTPHPLTDAYIAEFWADMDNPEGRAEVRRQFDALMAQIRTSSWKPFPRWPEAMAPVVVEKARLLPARLEIVKAALAGLPEHWKQWQWQADDKPTFGEKYVRSSIIGDSGHGFGRQWIASVNHVSKQYVGTLADFIAAANPDTVGMMVARIEELESQATPPVDGVAGSNAALTEALRNLEMANDNLCGARPQKVYDAMIAAGMSDRMTELDEARRDARTALAVAPPVGETGWNDPAAAPKDGTMLHLLVKPGQEELDAFTSFHDSRDPYETIGFNQMQDTLEDVWQFAGWDWCHDCITEGHGEVIGWLPFGIATSMAEGSVNG